MISKGSIAALIQKNRRILPGVAIIFILVSLLLFRSGYGYHLSFREEIEVKNELYMLTASALASKDELEKIIKKAEGRLKAFERGLLEAERPPIAAAKLQKAVKAIALKNGIPIVSERALLFAEDDDYLKIPVEFKLKADTKSLKDFLYEITASPLIMGVSEIKIRVDDSKRLDILITIEGMMSKEGFSS